MIKLVYIVRKRDDISFKDFSAYWLEKHGPLVRSFAKTHARPQVHPEPRRRARGLGGYSLSRVECHRASTASPKSGGTASKI